MGKSHMLAMMLICASGIQAHLQCATINHREIDTPTICLNPPLAAFPVGTVAIPPHAVCQIIAGPTPKPLAKKTSKGK